MIRKELVSPSRLRRMPEGFGWVDHRLVRKGYFKDRSRESLALYLFLITVGDAEGLSYYSQESLRVNLNFTHTELFSSRQELVKAELIAYRSPFYQVLELPVTIKEKECFDKVLRDVYVEKSEAENRETPEEICSVSDIIKRMIGEQ